MVPPFVVAAPGLPVPPLRVALAAAWMRISPQWALPVRVDPSAGVAMFASALGKGMLAGAAGTTALNAATYADMSARGRACSRTPQQTVAALTERTGHPVPGEGETRENRLTGLGSL